MKGSKQIQRNKKQTQNHRTMTLGMQIIRLYLHMSCISLKLCTSEFFQIIFLSTLFVRGFYCSMMFNFSEIHLICIILHTISRNLKFYGIWQNNCTSYDISISNQLQNSLHSNFKFIMLKKVSIGQNKDNMLINDLTVVAVIRKFDGVAMQSLQIHAMEFSFNFGITYLTLTSKNLQSSYDVMAPYLDKLIIIIKE